MRTLFVWASIGLPSLSAQPEDGIVLARDGQALATIVTADRDGVARFAATELKRYLDRVTGATFAIVANASKPPRVFIGDCPPTRAAGLDVAKLKRDGFYRVVKGGDVFLLGRDTPGRFRISAHDKKEHATLFAVYDFLEDVCGVRWCKSGPHGEVVPRRPTLAVKREVVKEEPFFVDRSLCQFGLHYYKYPDADQHEKEGSFDRARWGLRMRYETVAFAEGCHSSYYLKFAERFAKEHPDWFALQKNGDRAINTPRGAYLCYSHPGVIDAFIKDARAYFSGQPPESRGLKTWRKCGYGDELMVDPHDSYIFCQCPICLKTYEADPGQGYSEIIFAAVAKIAEAVKDFEGKYITTLAYGPKRQPPKTVVLPENVRVRLCVNGPIYNSVPGSRDEQLQLIKAWSSRMKGDLVLWLYNNAARPGGRVPGVPEVEPHAIADFLKAVRPYVKGAFFENESTVQTFRFLDEYIVLKLLWNPGQDVDQLLDDFFAKFFGPASAPMRRFYARLEELWKRTFTLYGGDRPQFAGRIDLWEKVYTTDELARLGQMLSEAAEKVKGQEAHAWRVDLIRKELLGRLEQNRAEFERTLGVAKQTQVTCFRSAVEPGGLLPAAAWQHMPRERLGPAPWRSKYIKDQELSVLTHFRVLWTPRNLHLLIEAEEPDLASSATYLDREPDDPSLWKDSTVEFFVTLHDERIMSLSTYQLLINDRGVFSDHARQLGKQDWGWDSRATVTVDRAESSWTANVAVPFESLGITDPLKVGRVAFNVVRHRSRRNVPPELYSWSSAGWGEPSRHGQLIFSPDRISPQPPNLLKGGGLDDPASGSPQPLAGWTIPRDDLPHVSLDTKTRWDGRGSARVHRGTFGSATLLQYLPPLKPDTQYRFRCKVKTKNVEPGTGGKYPRLNGVYANLYVPGANLHIPRKAITGTTDWRNIEFTARTARDLGKEPRFYVRLKIRNATGTAWFDEAEVREVEKK